jgi:hypothetical protein
MNVGTGTHTCLLVCCRLRIYYGIVQFFSSFRQFRSLEESPVPSGLCWILERISPSPLSEKDTFPTRPFHDTFIFTSIQAC